MRGLTSSLLLAASLAAGSGLVEAANLDQLVPEKSRVGFGFRQMGVPMNGSFPRFSGQISFDPAKLQTARASLEIDLKAVDAGGAEANDALQGKEWFDTRSWPQAKFQSATVRSLGGNRFEMSGKLSIKGRTKDVVLPFSFKPEGKGGVFEGSLAIRRSDFAVGEGAWADYGTVANEIQINFHLVATGK